MEGVNEEWVGRCSRKEAPDVKCAYPFRFGLVVWGFLMSLEGVTKSEAILVPGQGV